MIPIVSVQWLTFEGKLSNDSCTVVLYLEVVAERHQRDETEEDFTMVDCQQSVLHRVWNEKQHSGSALNPPGSGVKRCNVYTQQFNITPSGVTQTTQYHTYWCDINDLILDLLVCHKWLYIIPIDVTQIRLINVTQRT